MPNSATCEPLAQLACSRHGWLKNTTCSRPEPSPTLALTIVRRLRIVRLVTLANRDEHQRLLTGHEIGDPRASLVRSTQRRG